MSEFPDFFLAESMEATFVAKDPLGLGAAEDTVVHTLVVEGVFSTYANAEAALDLRNARFRDASPAEQFESYGTRMWKRDMVPPFDGATCWQAIRKVRVDAHTS